MLQSALENTWYTPALKVTLALFEVVLPAWAHLFSLNFAFKRGLRRSSTIVRHTSDYDHPLSTEEEHSLISNETAVLHKNLQNALYGKGTQNIEFTAVDSFNESIRAGNRYSAN